MSVSFRILFYLTGMAVELSDVSDARPKEGLVLHPGATMFEFTSMALIDLGKNARDPLST